MGGKLIPGAGPVTYSNIHTIESNLKKALPSTVPFFIIGSAGKKEIASDLDALIDANLLMSALSADTLADAKTKLRDHFISQGLYSILNGISVHVGIENGNGVSQCDLMIVENACSIAALHTHDYLVDPTMNGGTLHAMWADLLKLSNPHLKISPYKGLVVRETNELISSSKDVIARAIIDNTASAIDISSITSLFAALRPYPDKLNSIKEKYINNAN